MPRTIRPRRRSRFLAGALLMALLILPPGRLRAQGESSARDTLLITPTTQGRFTLPHSGVTLEIAYATVSAPAHLTISRQETPAGLQYGIAAQEPGGHALARFEMPLIAYLPPGEGPFPARAVFAGGEALPGTAAAAAGQDLAAVVGWPGELRITRDPGGAAADDRWLVIYDAHGVYAQPAWDTLPESIVYLGPLEGYTPALIRHDAAWEALPYDARPSPAGTARYADRFRPEVRSNPGAFAVLGWAPGADLPGVVRALRGTLPADPDLPAPGVPRAPLDLILPFDCTAAWAVSWGYHHAAPQNRFAVDFAVQGAPGSLGQPVYAAHAGTLYLKRYGPPDHPVDLGLAARVLAADGITSTVYGHLDPAGTFALWDLDPGALPDYAWVEIGPVHQGQVLGAAGRTGYATGAHIHFALWSWDQSLYQPIPLGPLDSFTRGQPVPAAARRNCERYARGR